MSQLSLLSPQDFFRTQVCEASKALAITLPSDIEFYLVNLLCEYIHPTAMTLDEENVLDKPLALMLAKAMESSPDHQIKALKRLGDTSLYVSGYFQDCFKRKAVDISYYIDMGSVAYGHTAQLMKTYKNDNHFSQIFSLLSQEFKNLVAVITEVAETLLLSRSDDLLNTYIKWQNTQSVKLRRILEERGVSPVLFSTKLSS
ncbi:MAG: hypothetical protein EOP10_34560 [Proteobacteria bacterium]|nr:MAG: hypothetical protein EOP10_34560 [Pseudomonadota bacterium]